MCGYSQNGSSAEARRPVTSIQDQLSSNQHPESGIQDPVTTSQVWKREKTGVARAGVETCNIMSPRPATGCFEAGKPTPAHSCLLEGRNGFSDLEDRLA